MFGSKSEKKAISESPMEVRNALVSLFCIRINDLSKTQLSKSCLDFRLILTRVLKWIKRETCSGDLNFCNREFAVTETIYQFLPLLPFNAAQDHAQAKITSFGGRADRSQDVSPYV